MLDPIGSRRFDPVLVMGFATPLPRNLPQFDHFPLRHALKEAYALLTQARLIHPPGEVGAAHPVTVRPKDIQQLVGMCWQSASRCHGYLLMH
jgi:hypothetical protein